MMTVPEEKLSQCQFCHTNLTQTNMSQNPYSDRLQTNHLAHGINTTKILYKSRLSSTRKSLSVSIRKTNWENICCLFYQIHKPQILTMGTSLFTWNQAVQLWLLFTQLHYKQHCQIKFWSSVYERCTKGNPPPNLGFKAFMSKINVCKWTRSMSATKSFNSDF
jgi:hypothetical protein